MIKSRQNGSLIGLSSSGEALIVYKVMRVRCACVYIPAGPGCAPRPVRADLPGISPESRCAAAFPDSAPALADISSLDC